MTWRDEIVRPSPVYVTGEWRVYNGAQLFRRTSCIYAEFTPAILRPLVRIFGGPTIFEEERIDGRSLGFSAFFSLLEDSSTCLGVLVTHRNTGKHALRFYLALSNNGFITPLMLVARIFHVHSKTAERRVREVARRLLELLTRLDWQKFLRLALDPDTVRRLLSELRSRRLRSVLSSRLGMLLSQKGALSVFDFASVTAELRHTLLSKTAREELEDFVMRTLAVLFPVTKKIVDYIELQRGSVEEISAEFERLFETCEVIS